MKKERCKKSRVSTEKQIGDEAVENKKVSRSLLSHSTDETNRVFLHSYLFPGSQYHQQAHVFQRSTLNLA